MYSLSAADLSPSSRLRSRWRKYCNPKAFRILNAIVTVFVLLITAGCGVSIPTQTPPVSISPAQTLTAGSTEVPEPVSSPTPSPVPATPTSSVSIKSDDLRGQAIQFWYVLPERLRLSGTPDPIAKAAELFNRSNPYGIEVKPVPYSEADRLYQDLEAASPEDLPSLISLSGPSVARLDSSTELIVDLGPYAADPTWGFTIDESQGLLPVFWSQDTLDEKRLGLPLYRNMQVLFYNQTWADELGYNDPPVSAQEFKEQACTAAQANMSDEDRQNNHTGGWLVSSGVETTASWFFAFNVSLEEKNSSGYKLDQDRAHGVLAFLREMYSTGCSQMDSQAAPAIELASRRALFISASLSAAPDIASAFSKAGSTDQWKVLPYPGSSSTPAVDVYGPSLAVLKSDPQEQMAAWLYARYLLTTEVQTSLVESLGVLPVSQAALDALDSYSKENLAWAQAVSLLQFARFEPSLASWSVARWTLRDAAVELYRPSFLDEKLPDLVQMLADTLDELESQY